MSDNSSINNISDTALWVAVYRALESKRPDALFNDPYAEILAGDRGKQIVMKMQNGLKGGWSIVVRTCILDEYIYKAINEHKVDTILNLAAGLDTRPYRLNLPSTMRWIEVDLPDILLYKEEKLANEKPRCHLERVKLDLRDIKQRNEILSQIDHDAKSVLVITEGLLIYLFEEDVKSLALDFHARNHFNWWIIDILSAELLEWLLKHTFKQFTTGDVTMQFAPKEGVEFFRPLGWEVFESRNINKESRRLNRRMPNARLYGLLRLLMSKRAREKMSRFNSSFVMMKRV